MIRHRRYQFCLRKLVFLLLLHGDQTHLTPETQQTMRKQAVDGCVRDVLH